MRAPVPTDGLLEGTPFKQIRARRAFDYCCVCRKRIGKGDCCYKPTKNEGGYKPEARICPPCFADKLSRQTREGN